MQTKGYKSNPNLIGLLHMVDWGLSADKFPLDTEVSLCKYKDSCVEKLVNHLAETQYLDDGEPLDYETFIQDTKLIGDYLGQSIDLLCSLIGIVYIGAPELAHIIYTNDYEDGRIIESIYSARKRQYEFLFNTIDEQDIKMIINDETADMVKILWANLKMDIPVKFDRIENALRFYTQAWVSNTEEEALLNLTIVLETLFAPPSQTEISHQIAMNICRFLRKSIEERRETYKLVKRIYAERSKIAHGDSPSEWKDFSNYLWKAYSLCAESLRFIMIDKTLITIFRDNELRREFLDNLQFK